MPQTSTKRRRSTAMLKKDLAEIARIGALFMDGDAAEAVHATQTSATWTDSDDINFAHDPYLNVKRTLLLIDRMQPFPYSCLFALRRADDPSLLEAVVCNMENPHGRAPFVPSPAQRRCITQGKATTEADRAGRVSAYAPVRNSDDEIVGLLHVFK